MRINQIKFANCDCCGLASFVWKTKYFIKVMQTKCALLCFQMFKEDNDDWCCFTTLKSHSSTVWSIAFDKTGSRLASCSDDKTVKIWQEYLPGNPEGIATKDNEPVWKCVCTLGGYHNRAIYAIDWNHGTGDIVTADGDNYIRIFRENECSDKNAPTFDLVASVRQAHTQDVNSVSWNPVADLLASCSDDGSVKIWRIVTTQ